MAVDIYVDSENEKLTGQPMIDVSLSVEEESVELKFIRINIRSTYRTYNNNNSKIGRF